MKRAGFVLILMLFLPLFLIGQRYYLPAGKPSVKVKFELVNNLIIVPIEVNGAELSFILDSGVGTPILFNLSDQDSIQINQVSEVTIKGLGQGEDAKALRSRGNHFKIGGVQNQNQQLYVVMDKSLNFSPSLGVPVHGIIGYDLFQNFAVEISYTGNFIKFHDPDKYKHKKGKKFRTFPLQLDHKKAYVKGAVVLEDKEEIPVKLLVDTGSSDAVWLFTDAEKGLELPEKNYRDFLGQGLSGAIYGHRTKVNSFKIGDFELRDAKAAFPDMETFSALKNLGDRNGSVGSEILKRFNMVFDYPNRKVTMRKNSKFGDAFHYNMSGIDLKHNGMRYIVERIADTNGIVVQEDGANFGNVQILLENKSKLSLVPEIIVSGIRAGSPSDLAGLQEGDLILAVNGKRVHQYKIQEIFKMLNEKDGKHIKVLVERANQDVLVSFVLKKIF
ncbi:aspartyl protease family protein [Sediminicola luteus]|uniref:Aspartate aminotransferase n=1 Tax=Sediminicola luteus TaxID=319238 RepID=A0A2A4G3C1_9FLAO|nr:aspartyl protease family protein [Sediminicola luteus]PCE63469.1 aspartate aminotransferase [Sediminicola luteus]